MLGLAQDGNPLVLERVLKSVLAVENIDDTSAYVFAGDLKVAEDGLERLYLECRDKGTMYVKLNEMPAVVQEGGSLSITYDDPVLQRKVQLTPDMIVVEEAIGADEVNAALAEMLKINVGSMGFLQTDNVHRYPVSTNREGIFVVGGSRRVKKRYGALMDAENAAIRVRALLGDGTITVPADKAVLDTGKVHLLPDLLPLLPPWRDLLVRRQQAGHFPGGLSGMRHLRVGMPHGCHPDRRLQRCRHD